MPQGLRGSSSGASTVDGETPRILADASSRPHNDMGAGLYINSVHFLYTSGEYYQNPWDRTVIGEKASSETVSEIQPFRECLKGRAIRRREAFRKVTIESPA